MASELRVDNIVERTAGEGVTVNGVKIPEDIGPYGKVLQVVSTILTSSFSTNSQTYTDVTGSDCYITPSSVNSKILVMATGSITLAGANQAFAAIRVVRDGSPIFNAITDGTQTSAIGGQLSGSVKNSMNGVAITGLDNPGTVSQITYTIQALTTVSAYPAFVGFNHTGTDSGTIRVPTVITLMEIGV
jgi:hypothetical protein